MAKAYKELNKFLTKHGKEGKFPMNQKRLGQEDQEIISHEKSHSMPRSETIGPGTADRAALHEEMKTAVQKKKGGKKPYC